MSRGFLITGTDTGVGKTLVGCSIARAARARGVKAGVMKPAETGCAEARGALEPADARALALAAGSLVPLKLICPYRYRSPLAPAAAAEADKLPPPDLDLVIRAFREIAAQSDVVIVEGAGGLAVPITWETDYARLARALDLDAVVVVGNRLGCLNAALLTFHYALGRGLRVTGYVLNDTVADPTPATLGNEASLSRLTDVPYLGRVRFNEPVSLGIIDAVLGVQAVTA